MKLIIGLGNPGSKYTFTRHNAGFLAVDYYCKNNNINLKFNAKLKGELGKTKDAIFLKPTTFMNLSGESVKAVMKFYNINSHDIIVIIDDLSLPTGKLRVRDSGSSGGHNGLKSISQHLGNDNYPRIKIGIDRSNVMPVSDYVLGKFEDDEFLLIEQAIVKTKDVIDDFIKNMPIKKICSTRN